MSLDPILYLANIISVAQSNGRMSAAELGQLEEIRTRDKLKKGDLNAALRLVEQGAHNIRPIGRFSERVKNLEMMLLVAYADDDLDDQETLFINNFADAIGLNKDQIELIRQEVLADRNPCPKMCPQCGASADKDSKFCPACGLGLALEEVLSNCTNSVSAYGITIEFSESTSASFPKALQHAKEISTFRNFERNKKKWYSVNYVSGNLEEAMPLIQCLNGLRNRYVFVDGEEKNWDELLGFAWCAAQRATAYRPIEYCFGKEGRLNLWGCKQARMDWTEWADWFCYGRWEKGGVFGGKLKWRFDKDRIKHELQSNLFRYRFCPYLLTDLSEAVIKHLPDVVTPDSDPNWGYHRSYEATPGAVKVVEKDRSAGFTFTNEYWADGVSPKGLKAFEEILIKASRELGERKIDVPALVK